MIKSIQFQDGGYITIRQTTVKYTPAGKKKIEKYKKAHHNCHLEDMTDNGIIRNVRLTEGTDYLIEDARYKNPQLVQNLLNRKIDFKPAAINVIFGPNASGKSTILKALAAYCQCGNSDNLDGWTDRFFITPRNVHSKNWVIFSDSDDKENVSIDTINESIQHHMKNNAVVDWDGVPVYADNFSTRKTTGRLGDLSGSIFEDSGFDEFLYRMNKSQISLGQNSIFILRKITKMMEKPYTLDDVLGARKIKGNDVWKGLFNANIRRLEKIYNDCDEHSNLCNTFIFDEIDKSMDIYNVAFLYGELLPDLVKKYGIQIIIVSHSPLILTKNIVDNPLYNIISMNDEYTQSCKEMLSKFAFN